jgi:hypothetical protein
VGGAVPADGLFCACPEFRRGADCASLDPAFFAPASVFLLLIALCAWLVVFAQRTRREIVLYKKQGNGEPLRALRLVQVGAVFMGLAVLSDLLMLVSPLPFGALWVAFDIFSNITPGCYLALVAYLVIMFRALTRQTEGRASTAVRDTRIAHVYVVSAAVCMLATSKSRFRQIIFLILGFVVLLPFVRSAIEVSRIMRESDTITPNSEIRDALGRIRRILRHWALCFACFVALRVSLVLTQRSQAPVQETVWYYLRLLTRWASNLNGLHCMVVVVQYVGGPARAASRRISTEIPSSHPSARVPVASSAPVAKDAEMLERWFREPSFSRRARTHARTQRTSDRKG